MASTLIQNTDILSRYDITGMYAQHLNKLAGFKIVCICDD